MHLVHLEEESTRRDEEVESEDPDGIGGVTEEFMVHLTRAIKDAQVEEKCCYHCSSLEHFCDGLFSFIVCWVQYGSHIRIRYGIGYGTDIALFLLLLSVNVICDLYFDSHILVVLIITLILFILLVLNVYM